MDLPLELVIENIEDSFVGGKLYLFKNKNYDKNASAHYHIALRAKDSQYLILNMITSKVEKKIRYYTLTNKNLIDSVIQISSDDIALLSKDSCIDCNQPMYVTKEELNALVADGIKYIKTTINKNLKQTIIEAVLSSSMVRDEIKEDLK